MQGDEITLPHPPPPSSLQNMEEFGWRFPRHPPRNTLISLGETSFRSSYLCGCHKGEKGGEEEEKKAQSEQTVQYSEEGDRQIAFMSDIGPYLPNKDRWTFR